MSRFGFGLGFGASFGSGGGGIPLSIQRNFTTLDAAFSMYYDIPVSVFSGEFELSVDILINESSGDFRVLDEINNGWDLDTLTIYIDDPDGLEMIVGTGGSFIRHIFGGYSLLTDGKLHNIRFVRDSGDNVVAYIDGVQQGSSVSITGTSILGTLLGGGNNGFLDGILSDFKVNDAGTLIRDYPIDEDWVGPSTVLNDRSGNNQHGTAVNIDTDDAELFTFDGDVSPNTWTNIGATRVIEVAGT